MLKAIWRAMLGTANKLQTPRNISLNGAVSGNVNFDGSTNVTINTVMGNIVVLEGMVTLTNGKGSTILNYPERVQYR